MYLGDRLRFASTFSPRAEWVSPGHLVAIVAAPDGTDVVGGTRVAYTDTGPGGIYARIEELGHRLDHFTEDVAARMPTPDETRSLKLGPGVPVFHLVRTAYDTKGQAVEVCDTVMAADRYVLAYELPAR